MVKRHAKARFMPNYHVFPGGIGMYKHALSDQSVEMSDSSPAWDGVSTIPSKANCQILKNEALSIKAEERTLKIAALRELYEEANLLVSNPHIPADQLRDAHRKDLNGEYCNVIDLLMHQKMLTCSFPYANTTLATLTFLAYITLRDGSHPSKKNFDMTLTSIVLC